MLPFMTKDIHIWLTDEEAAGLAARAKADDRSITNMARVYIRAGLLGVERPSVEAVGYSDPLEAYRKAQAQNTQVHPRFKQGKNP